jgi:hypothetical protein
METGFDIHGGKLWVGRHSGDGDTLVFDPALGEGSSEYVSLFSLTQLRPRAFPLQVVQQRIEPISDAAERAAALKRYRTWPSLKAERERAQVREREEGTARRREQTLALHRAYLEARGVAYKGVRDSSEATAGGPPKRARSVCGNCGIRLDDYVGTRCVACNGVLCSCGACACVGTVRSEA